MKKIHTWLFHVLAHIYHAHYKEILQLCLHGHLNTFFLHFSIFNRRYRLVEEKEYDLLEDLYQKLRNPVITPTKDSSGSGSSREKESPSKELGPEGLPTGVNSNVTMEGCLEGQGQGGQDGDGVKNGKAGGDMEAGEGQTQTVVMADDNKENSTPMAQQAPPQAQANGQPRNPSS